jgi:hypothetical protein
VKVCGVDAATVQAVIDQLRRIAEPPGSPFGRTSGINADAIVISTPEIAGLPYVIAGLVAAGGLAAALSTADGLLLAIANALSHDIYYKMIDPNAPTARRRLVVARVLLVLVAIARPIRPRHVRPTSWRWWPGPSPRRGGPLPGAGARHLVEAGEPGRLPSPA